MAAAVMDAPAEQDALERNKPWSQADGVPHRLQQDSVMDLKEFFKTTEPGVSISPVPFDLSSERTGSSKASRTPNKLSKRNRSKRALSTNPTPAAMERRATPAAQARKERMDQHIMQRASADGKRYYQIIMPNASNNSLSQPNSAPATANVTARNSLLLDRERHLDAVKEARPTSSIYGDNEAVGYDGPVELLTPHPGHPAGDLLRSYSQTMRDVSTPDHFRGTNSGAARNALSSNPPSAPHRPLPSLPQADHAGTFTFPFRAEKPVQHSAHAVSPDGGEPASNQRQRTTPHDQFELAVFAPMHAKDKRAIHAISRYDEDDRDVHTSQGTYMNGHADQAQEARVRSSTGKSANSSRPSTAPDGMAGRQSFQQQRKERARQRMLRDLENTRRQRNGLGHSAHTSDGVDTTDKSGDKKREEGPLNFSRVMTRFRTDSIDEFYAPNGIHDNLWPPTGTGASYSRYRNASETIPRMLASANGAGAEAEEEFTTPVEETPPTLRDAPPLPAVTKSSRVPQSSPKGSPPKSPEPKMRPILAQAASTASRASQMNSAQRFSQIADPQTRLQARVDHLERENKLLQAALDAVLRTAGELNGCPYARRSQNNAVRSSSSGKTAARSPHYRSSYEGSEFQKQSTAGKRESGADAFSRYDKTPLEIYKETKVDPRLSMGPPS